MEYRAPSASQRGNKIGRSLPWRNPMALHKNSPYNQGVYIWRPTVRGMHTMVTGKKKEKDGPFRGYDKYIFIELSIFAVKSC